MTKRLCHLAVLLLGTITVASAAEPPLAFPKTIKQPLKAEAKEQVLTFFGTNLTAQAVNLAGYSSSCGCTSVESRSTTVPPHGQVEFQVHIERNRPVAEYAVIQDQYTNVYAINFIVTAPMLTIGESSTNGNPKLITAPTSHTNNK